MKVVSGMIKISFVTVLLFLLIGCSRSNDEPDFLSEEKEVRVMFSINGVGDQSFNDDILRGVMESQKENGFLLQYYIPVDPADAENKLKEWLLDDDNERTFTILATNEYEDLARELLKGEWRSNFLLIEASSRDFTIPVLCFAGYGVSFLAGVSAYSHTKGDTAVYLGGERGHRFIEECYHGFKDGYLYAGGEYVVAEYLSDKPDGFAMPLRAYIMADSLYHQYPFIYPIAGGSNSGIYQYLREHTDMEGYTAGVDVDQSAYSDRIIGSMIKEVGRAIGDYISIWLKGEVLPEWQLFDLQSEYVSFRPAESYKARLIEVIDSHMDIACKKEEEYNEERLE